MNLKRALSSLTLLTLLVAPAAGQTIPSPSSFLGMDIGADRTLADYHQIVSYFKTLEQASPRVSLVDLGETTLGNRMIMTVISSEQNIAALPRIREVSSRLADPRGLAEAAVAGLIDEGKVVVLVTCNIHSTEIASSQMAMEWAWELAVATDAKTIRRLDQVVLLLVPSLNPDGQIMVVDWYRKTLGTPYEGGPMPWLYHHYVGHDNNRDWFMLTQKETRALTRAIYHEWFPQIFVDHHQMGSSGPRMFIPPFSDPMDPDVHPLIWREIQLIGSNMALRLEQAEKSGVIYGYAFDAYWLGGTRNTGWWKNVTGLLLETASAKIASPVEVHPTELSGGRKGLIEYKPQVNHPNPWPGGRWRLGDIMDYQKIASNALLETAAHHREDFLRNLVRRARTAVESAAPREAYVIPRAQRDPPSARRLAELMADHGVNVLVSDEGDFLIPLAQPYSRFVREMLETQRYPEVKVSAQGEILAPYDVSTWSLPLLMGVNVEKRRMPGSVEGKLLRAPILGQAGSALSPEPARAPFYAVSRTSPEAFRVVNELLRTGAKVWTSTREETDLVAAPVPVRLAEGTLFFEASSLQTARAAAAEGGVSLIPIASLPAELEIVRRPRVGVYKPWSNPSMDEGWTRFVLDGYGFDPVSIDPAAVRAAGSARGTSLRQRVDVIILPDISKEMLATGRPKVEEGESRYFASYPPEYEGGLGKEGATALQRFVEAGGTLIGFDSSTNYLIEQFNIPVRNVLVKEKRAEFSAPGALLRAQVTQEHPVTWGLPEQIAIFHDDSTAFQTVIPGAETGRWVLAWYPEDPRDILLSGWIRGQEKLTRRAAAVALQVGSGRMVLFGFRPQYRAQTHATFPFLFNAIYWSMM